MKPYANREIDMFISEIKEQLDRIEKQTVKTNGRVYSLENELGSVKVKLYIVGAIAGTVLIMKFPEIANLIKLI
jgi:hypothetical protein